MISRQWILAPTLITALMAYGSDCVETAPPEQAMRCCSKMHCHSHRRDHSQNCCNTTPRMAPALGQPASIQSVCYSPVTLGVLEAARNYQLVEFSLSIFARHSHDPPPFCSARVTSLRI